MASLHLLTLLRLQPPYLVNRNGNTPNKKTLLVGLGRKGLDKGSPQILSSHRWESQGLWRGSCSSGVTAGQSGGLFPKNPLSFGLQTATLTC